MSYLIVGCAPAGYQSADRNSSGSWLLSLPRAPVCGGIFFDGATSQFGAIDLPGSWPDRGTWQ